MCRTCERSMTMAAKARRDFLLVDDFWRRYLFKHGIPDGRHKNPDEIVSTEPVKTLVQSSIDEGVVFDDTNMPAPIAVDNSIIDTQRVDLNPLYDPLPIEIVHVKTESNLDDDDEIKIEYPQPFGDFDHFADGDDDNNESNEQFDVKTKKTVKRRIKDRLSASDTKFSGARPAGGDKKRFRCSSHECTEGKYC